MHEISSMKFGELETLLGSMGFEEQVMPGHVAFVYPGGRPMIILPRYRKNAKVKPIHLLNVKKTLDDVGLLEPDGIRPVTQAK
jgi:hypothetical protein